MPMTEREVAWLRQRAERALVKSQTILMPWMRRVAAWEAGQNGRISVRVLQTVCEEMAGCRVSRNMAAALRARQDYAECRDGLRGDEMARQRERLMHRAQDYIDAHYEALLGAQAAKDFALMAKIAEPVLDRVAPKKEEREETAPVIHLHLSGATTRADIVEGEFEVVEVQKQLTPGA